MKEQKMTAIEIQEVIADSFFSAEGYLGFMRSGDNNAAAWADENGVEVDEREYDEAISRIKESFKHAALVRIEADIKGCEFDKDGTYVSWLKEAEDQEIAAIAEISYDQAREIIAENGTLF